MNHFFPVTLFLILLGCTTSGASEPLQIPAPPAVGAAAHILQDYHSGRVLAEGNADARVEPASLTKMMTAYVVFSALKEGKFQLDSLVRISEKAWRTGGSRMFLELGTEVPVEALLKGLIIQSGNDASVALAEYVAGDEQVFAGLMNQHAQRLALTGTHFANATGLPDPDEYTTARDMAALATALIRDFPEHYPWHALREFTYNNIVQHNRNKLLWQDESVDGLKTGFTNTAGYCLVASAQREGMRLISVVMGSESVKSRTSQSRALLEYGFRFFETRRVYGANESVTQVRVWKGHTSKLDLGLPRGLYATVPRGQGEKLQTTLEVDPKIIAPVSQGETHGVAKVFLEGAEVAAEPLVALQSVTKASFLGRLFDQFLLLFQ
jgi:D-alanyl-D-alanine carboxypeptidase (penicillin-binding protein 5/6)